jgi:hypothetical protein
MIPARPSFVGIDGPMALYQEPGGGRFGVPLDYARQFRPEDFPDDTPPDEAFAGAPAQPDPLPNMPAPGPVTPGPAAADIVQRATAAGVQGAPPSGPAMGAPGPSPPAVAPLGAQPAQAPSTRPAPIIAAPGRAATGPQPGPEAALDVPSPMDGMDGFQRSEALAQRGFELQDEAITQQTEAAQERADQEAAAIEERNRRLVEVEEERARAVAEEQKRLATLQKRTEDAINAHANAKVDQNRLWRDMGTGKQIGAIIAAALGGLGATLAGKPGENPALDMLMKKIDQDVQLQMADIDKMGQEVQMRRGQVSDYMQSMGSSEAAYSAAMSGYLKRTARDLELIEARSKNPEVQARAQQLRADVLLKAAEYGGKSAESEYRRDFGERQFSEQQRQARRQEGLAGARLAEDRRQFNETMGARLLDMQMEAEKLRQAGDAKGAEKKMQEVEQAREQGVFNDSGEPLRQKDGQVFMAGKTDAPKLREEAAKRYQFTTDLSRMIELRRQYDYENPAIKSAARKEMESLGAKLKGVGKSSAFLDLGVPSGPDMELLLEFIGDPTGVRDPTPALTRLIDGVETDHNKSLRARGYTGETVKMPRYFDSKLGGSLDYKPTVRQEVERSLTSRDKNERTGALRNYLSNLQLDSQQRAKGGKPVLSDEERTAIVEVIRDRVTQEGASKDEQKTFRSAYAIARKYTDAPPLQPPAPGPLGLDKYLVKGR